MGALAVNLHIFYNQQFKISEDYAGFVIACLIAVYLIGIYFLSFVLLILYSKTIQKGV